MRGGASATAARHASRGLSSALRVAQRPADALGGSRRGDRGHRAERPSPEVCTSFKAKQKALTTSTQAEPTSLTQRQPCQLLRETNNMLREAPRRKIEGCQKGFATRAPDRGLSSRTRATARSKELRAILREHRNT
jgi:hypothetical protein